MQYWLMLLSFIACIYACWGMFNDLHSPSHGRFLKHARLSSHDIAMLANQSNLPDRISRTSFIYIGTNEGTASRFIQLQVMYFQTILRSKFKQLILVSVACKQHYPEMAEINYCHVFDFPDNIICVDNDPNDIVELTPCFTPHETGWMHSHSTYDLKPEAKLIVNVTDSPIWTKMTCFVGFTTYFPAPTHSFPLKFSPSYVHLFEVAQYNFLTNYKYGIGHVPSKLEMQTTRKSWCILAYHWRRGDRMHMCKGSTTAEGFNCGTVEDLIQYVRSTSSKYFEINPSEATKRRLLFVATNEKDPEVLKSIKKEGILVGFELLPPTVNNLDLFALETQWMIDADEFFSEGGSNVPKLVKLGRDSKDQDLFQDVHRAQVSYYMSHYNSSLN